ncbi:uncharacterized protein FIBRA_05824 [Fibroporia radiculosa]|uniref:Uncharacterized protein n=1 Tax=Fibroporia radiculosa TaxID=599839 RepID=J4GRP2_9APHY|nr:uncharacterized protein FIBRA_05824 [Fibroporia radiculosa]CCM03680.1 predicted protein [Fibroporia radiculosa]
MASTSAWLFLMLCPSLFSYVYAAPDEHLHARGAPPTPFWRRSSVPSVGFYNPTSNGGQWLTQVQDTYPPGQGEPINVVISGDSDTAVLQNQEINGGLLNYFISFGYSTECLGQHQGAPQAANLGDGLNFVNQTAEIRWDYGNPELGTCEETIEGGSHFRYWSQDGSQADSNAVFMASSYELPETDQHNIIFNGYNLGRDWLVGNVTNQTQIINSTLLTNSSEYTGKTAYGGYTYQTTAKYYSGFLPNTSYGVNHNLSVGNAQTNAVDGWLAVLTVKIVDQPQSSSARLAWSTPSWQALLLSIVAAFFLHTMALTISV